MELLPTRLRSGVVTGEISGGSVSVAGAWALQFVLNGPYCQHLPNHPGLCEEWLE